MKNKKRCICNFSGSPKTQRNGQGRASFEAFLATPCTKGEERGQRIPQDVEPQRARKWLPLCVAMLPKYVLFYLRAGGERAPGIFGHRSGDFFQIFARWKRKFEDWIVLWDFLCGRERGERPHRNSRV